MTEELTLRANRFLANLSAFLDRAQDGFQEWATREFTATVGDPEVTARVTGAGGLSGIDISVLARRSLDNITLGEVIVEAVTRAEESAAEAKAEFLSSLQIGGVDVGGLLARGDETLRDWTRER